MTGPGRGEPADLVRSLDAAIRLLGQATGGPTDPAQPPGDEPGPRGHGTAADGLVEAEVAGYGRLESLTIDPTLLRAGTTAIAEYVLTAVRAAQDDERDRRPAGPGGAGGDPGALAGQLDEVAGNAWRGFDRMVGDLDALTRRLDGR
jgi:hypothetical protein